MPGFNWLPPLATHGLQISVLRDHPSQSFVTAYLSFAISRSQRAGAPQTQLRRQEASWLLARCQDKVCRGHSRSKQQADWPLWRWDGATH